MRLPDHTKTIKPSLRACWYVPNCCTFNSNQLCMRTFTTLIGLFLRVQTCLIYESRFLRSSSSVCMANGIACSKPWFWLCTVQSVSHIYIYIPIAPRQYLFEIIYEFLVTHILPLQSVWLRYNMLQVLV